MTKFEFFDVVSNIQQEIKAPKNQFNKFGKYKYRSCEDIVEGFKKMPTGLVLLISDEVVMVGDRIYVKATVTLTDGEHEVSSTALARESLTKKGMDDSQITGTASSYARKYALNGLFCIDDTKDADSMDNAAISTSTQAKGGFILDSIAMGWIDSIDSGTNKLEEITDPQYREFIKGKLK